MASKPKVDEVEVYLAEEEQINKENNVFTTVPSIIRNILYLPWTPIHWAAQEIQDDYLHLYRPAGVYVMPKFGTGGHDETKLVQFLEMLYTLIFELASLIAHDDDRQIALVQLLLQLRKLSLRLPSCNDEGVST